jgi:hypothetical protein
MAHFYSLFIILITCFGLEALAAPTFFTNLFRRDDQPCNGDTALCNKQYSKVSFIGTHDSPFIGPLLTQDQEQSVLDQLNNGIRFLQSQVHPFLGIPFMCHTSCMLENGGSVENYLKTIKTWLDAHPREVVTLLMTNPEHMQMSKWAPVFKKVGADKYAYIPSTSPAPMAPDAWPTMGDLINSGKRLVVFVGEFEMCFLDIWWDID